MSTKAMFHTRSVRRNASKRPLGDVSQQYTKKQHTTVKHMNAPQKVKARYLSLKPIIIQQFTQEMKAWKMGDHNEWSCVVKYGGEWQTFRELQSVSFLAYRDRLHHSFSTLPFHACATSHFTRAPPSVSRVRRFRFTRAPLPFHACATFRFTRVKGRHS